MTLQVWLSPRNSTSVTLALISFQPGGSGVQAACAVLRANAFSGRIINISAWSARTSADERMPSACPSKLATPLPCAVRARKFELPRNEATKAFGGF
ncbi:hypothetical protein D3C76_1712990 [compost metagenome]